MTMTQAETWGAFSELDGPESATSSPGVQPESLQNDKPVDEDLATALARLIRTHPAVRRAVLGVVMSCPNIRTET